MASYTHLMMLDMDDINTLPWDTTVITDALAWMDQQPQLGGIFPNQIGHYDDLWALRESNRCPGDVWEEVLMRAMQSGQPNADATAHVMGQRSFTLPAEATPWQVDSAFGGFGIYRMDACLHNPAPYCGEGVVVWEQGQETQVARWQRCEHVNFNLGLHRLGYNLAVLLQMMNANTHTWGHEPDAFRTMLF